jgi:exodeoxyribonuclease-3
MPLSIATWNINSVRLRLDLVARFVEEARPDVLCLQEIKCRDGEFPANAFARMGLRHLKVTGQKGWHGVAIASRLPIEPTPTPAFCPRQEARVSAAKIDGIVIHNVYVPAGGEIPDMRDNSKFAHKLEVIARMRAYYETHPAKGPRILVGDLNIAPGENDVWSHRQLIDVVSHTPVEVEGIEAIRTAGGFVDLARVFHPCPQKLYSWWSYRSPDWKRSNRGRRLDHIYADPASAARCTDVTFHAHVRDWERPSDHVPVVARFN